MIWLTWRQHRTELVASVVAVIALIVWMVVVRDNYLTAGVHVRQACATDFFSAPSSACLAYEAARSSAADQARIIGTLLIALPGLIGMVLGAPLIGSEMQRGTATWVFTQSITRRRWLVTRWFLVGAVVLALATTLAILTTWWDGAVPASSGYVGNRMQPGGFELTGVVPIAYALFGFSLGAGLGAIARRSRAAAVAVVTLVLFATSRLLVEQAVRPNLATQSFLPSPDPGNGISSILHDRHAWFLDWGYRVAPGSGHPQTASYVNGVLHACSSAPPTYWSCIADHGVQGGAFFQPGSHYWQIQWGEAAIFVAAAGALFLAAYWAVRRWRA